MDWNVRDLMEKKYQDNRNFKSPKDMEEFYKNPDPWGMNLFLTEWTRFMKEALMVKEIIHLDRYSKPRILDFGCGEGWLVPFLAGAGISLENYHGVDISGKAIERAQARTLEFFHGRDIEKVFEKKTIQEISEDWDIIIFGGVLFYMGQEWVETQEKIKRSCKYAVITCPIKSMKYSQISGFQQILEEEKRIKGYHNSYRLVGLVREKRGKEKWEQ